MSFTWLELPVLEWGWGAGFLSPAPQIRVNSDCPEQTPKAEGMGEFCSPNPQLFSPLGLQTVVPAY